MNYQLIYSVAEHSTAATTAAVYGVGIGAAALIGAAVVYFRGGKIGVGVKFFAVASLIMLVVSALTVVEKRVIASKSLTEGKTVEGVIAQHWTSYGRRPGSTKADFLYEGFYVNGVHFSYTTNMDGNYFNNAGKQKIDMRDGMQVRVQYLEEISGEDKRNHITRFELAR